MHFSKECSRKGHKSDISGFLEQNLLGSKTQQAEAYPRPELTKQISKIRDFHNGDPREHKDLLANRQMSNSHRFKLPFISKLTVQEIPVFSCSGSVLPIQSTTIWSVHYSNGIHNSSQGSQTDGSRQRYKRIHQYLDNCLVKATPYQTCLQHTQTLVPSTRK